MPPHIAHTDSVNAICPSCSRTFGYIVENGEIKCPACSFVQPLPIIKIGPDLYFCIPCSAIRTALDVQSAICINCAGKPLWEVPRSARHL